LQYDHNRFLPGHFERLDILLNQAMDNLQGDMPEAALLGRSRCTWNARRPRLELEKLTNEWQMLFQESLSAVDELLEQLQAGKIIPALDTAVVSCRSKSMSTSGRTTTSPPSSAR